MRGDAKIHSNILAWTVRLQVNLGRPPEPSRAQVFGVAHAPIETCPDYLNNTRCGVLILTQVDFDWKVEVRLAPSQGAHPILHTVVAEMINHVGRASH